jgi:prophage regulatory protein
MATRSIHLVGAHEIRKLLSGKVTRQRVYQIINGKSFPRPYATLSQGKVWLTEDVEAWIREHRPPRPST